METSKSDLLNNAQSDSFNQVLNIERTLTGLEETWVNIVDEMNWTSIREEAFDKENYQSLLSDIADEVIREQNALQKLKKEINLTRDTGPCVKSIDDALKSIGIECQAYYGSTLIGNHCHKLLKPVNIDTFFNVLPNVILETIGDLLFIRCS